MPADSAAWPQGRLRAAAWVVYDLANTVYAATLTFLFAPFVAQAYGERASLGYVQFASMLVAGLLVPWLGALLDHTARTRSYLAVTTLACIAAMAGFGLDLGKPFRLGCFFVANLTYNLALLSYNALLPSVARADRTGQLSGIGTGVGYLGTILVLVTLLPLDAAAAVRFPLAGLLFLLLAAPCLLLCRDRRTPRPGHARAALRAASAGLVATLRDLPQRPALRWFLIANFCLVDVLNTAVLFFADFTTDTFRAAAAAGTLSLFGHRFAGEAGLQSLLQWFGLGLNGLALGFGVLLGRWTDRAPLGVLRLSGLALLVALFGGAATAGHSPLGYLLTLVLGGALGLAGVWTAGRTIVVRLAPPDRVGAYFGLYGITVKLSVVGSVVYGEVATRAGSAPAMLAQSVQLLVGLGCLAMVRLPASRHAGGPP